MHKLLVPVDSSENSIRALDYAIGLAKQFGLELRLVNAQEEPIVYGGAEVYLTEEKARQLLHEHSEELIKPAVDRARTAGVRFTSAIIVGDVATAIASQAEQNGCDGIVMGTRGMSAIGNLLMGSIATKVIHLSKLPVTLVK